MGLLLVLFHIVVQDVCKWHHSIAKGNLIGVFISPFVLILFFVDDILVLLNFLEVPKGEESLLDQYVSSTRNDGLLLPQLVRVCLTKRHVFKWFLIKLIRRLIEHKSS